jgi:hypothetical protein
MLIQLLINKIKTYKNRNNLLYILGRFRFVRLLSKKFRILFNNRKIISYSDNSYLLNEVKSNHVLRKLNKDCYY